MLSYFQSQQSSLGNSVNIAGKNRYLTSNLLSQTEKYIDGSSDASQLRAAMNRLESNIITLKQGGMISGVDLKPLSSDFVDLRNIVNGNWNLTKHPLLKKCRCHINRSKEQQHHQSINNYNESNRPIITKETIRII